ncbi:MAG TPA: protealysin inhibitor emfourin [Nocardioidaceae bacterium]|nr:protealysin inhibitor emfourin [Nocardioidaceae bacterium]
MKVSVVRGGGLAGITTRTELSASALGEEDAHTFTEKVRAAGLREARPAGGGPSGPDRTLYEVVLDDSGSVVRSRFTDDDLPESVRRLVEWVDARPERSHTRER